MQLRYWIIGLSSVVIAIGQSTTRPELPSHLFPSPDSILQQANGRILFHPADSLQPVRHLTTNHFIGIAALFSEYGFGLGIHYQQTLSPHLTFFLNFDLSGIRKTDEFEYYYPERNQFLVPNKINRLYTLPLTIGLQYYPFFDTFAETFQPFALVGGGIGIIGALPYRANRHPEGEYVSFWSALDSALFFLRPAFVAGIGTRFSTFTDSRARFAISYYYIPFGSPGLESIAGLPILNFGGLFLSLTLLFSL